MKITLAERLKKFLVVSIAGCAVLAWAAAPTSIPLANLTEKWDTANGWQAVAVDEGMPVWTWADGGLSIAYSAQSSLAVPESGIGAKLFAIDVTGNGRFSGDYAGNGIFQVTFDTEGWLTGAGVYFYFTARNGHEWRLKLNAPAIAGGKQTVEVPLSFTEQWLVLGTREQPSASLMQADLADVAEIGVIAFKSGPAAEAMRIDNFKLVGPWNGNFTDGIADSWRIEHGITGEDPDKDGVSNYAEFMAGTDPNDAKSFFVIEIGKNAQGQTALTWKHEYGRVFKLVKTTDLVSENQVQETVKTLQSVAPKNEVVVDEQGPGPYFYKVEITQ